MAKFEGFEEIEAWQKAYSVTLEIYQVTEEARFARDFGLRDQIRRASVSVMANIAEGHGRKSNSEFANFLNIAHGSVAETQSHLYIALDLGYLDQPNFSELYSLLEEVARMTMALMKHLRG